jgi:AmiR/NasT family two-component response regulator
MTNDTNSDLFWARDVIEQSQGIIMNRFDLDAVRALEVLRRMSLNTRTQMCVLAEQLINHDLPVDAVRVLEEVVQHGFR